ncbi:UDP-N-acetylmuramoyl-tripeptide--D-alanyl-D-alanine ligase,putative bifunctional UDP-N-acetylmuramoylalanyl-D-glutamate--2,6-diaminopimelateligase/UDP-N-acetylmuramoyl-tripeptide:D-alanyl-D-alanine ligase,Folylpolyglutamate synthase,UDP-N-acetylmuramoyl-tripeptide--D-alanyl-D-alanine ligase,Mur ligase middle domain [Chlamydia serpentis]|uniref:UDP-N-acetylmuramoyl-tripeptide--D-alanyl-D-alanine ligase n=1 Tax=Chlamydia serpentis TaxID=1967782 RepID=A0A2R8FC53_9CHLA|nr:UDP-N-acetylmuramoyl-tripeptide--D-alanyl-D-alanine ligase [Chlamydia serpentis]SPN74009.1 UDP-N-acetylmuramoyl-tripeptide--D-alanyl-D-alanine ligase,putative bifunctional UDP-N-acetylmuramoylalanyl-D-glutamate--2,6-diaminopimelateligase/UDP-N-acetylmuramoyl-tripeptide:D-alanyl-D-alanine ligase,Folylpolyglutamate synthase,UDP-N-acetylmuramoyl-tripeptide--D-alanyl-D-alanine ligase,Mur ligase middle domain [Chlamydia serpentis]
MRTVLLEDWVSLMLSDVSCPKSNKKISGFAIDSRQVQPGDLFFALPGIRTDGHQFLKHAAQSGAVAAVVSSEYQGDSFGLLLIRVQDPKCALQEAGNSQYNLFRGNLIGITGSIGKTTTKEFSKTLLSSIYKIHASPKSYNSQLTVPLSLLMAEGDEDFIILEMGVSEPGNMRDLLNIVQPEIAVITQINDQHAVNFPEGIQGIIREKSLILEKSKVQLLPKDSLCFSDLWHRSFRAEKFSFSFNDPLADFYYKAMSRESVVIHTPNEDYHLPIAFSYKPAYSNLLIAVALSWILDIPEESIIGSLSTLKLPPMRFEHSIRNGIQVINDAYNACPEAMMAALDSLPLPSDGGKTILILGHMAELGIYSEAGHALIAEKAASLGHMIFFIGEKWIPVQHLLKNYSCEVNFFSSAQDIKDLLKAVVRHGDVILLKGSRSLALESLLACF